MDFILGNIQAILVTTALMCFALSFFYSHVADGEEDNHNYEQAQKDSKLSTLFKALFLCFFMGMVLEFSVALYLKYY